MMRATGRNAGFLIFGRRERDFGGLGVTVRLVLFVEGYLSKVVQMQRRKTPADPGARRVLAELAQDTREKIRECRLALDWIITKGPASVKANTRLFQIADKIGWLRDNYRANRKTVEQAEAMLDETHPAARVLRSYGINPSPAGIPPERWLPDDGFRALMARRQRLAAGGGSLDAIGIPQRGIPPNRKRAR